MPDPPEWTSATVARFADVEDAAGDALVEVSVLVGDALKLASALRLGLALRLGAVECVGAGGREPAAAEVRPPPGALPPLPLPARL